jgi:hypothetical protein
MRYLELKPGWVVRVPDGMNMMQMARYRFDPVTLLLVAGAVVGTTATIQQGRAADAQGRFQEKIAARNAEEKRKEAEGARTAAAEAAIEAERQGKEAKGRRRAAQAVSGTAIGRGSNLTTLVKEAEILEADRLTILREGAIRGSSLEAQAGNIQAQGTAAKARGSAAKRASVLSATGGALSSTATIGKSRFDRGLKPFSPGRR